MSSEKTSTSADINALAAEVMDLWQEHLTIYASDPKAKAELMHLLEPQRQLFADWATMMQNGLHANSASAQSANDPGFAAPTAGAAPAAASSDDGALRLAQLAHRVAELEKRLAKLESRGSRAAPKTPRRTKPSQH